MKIARPKLLFIITCLTSFLLGLFFTGYNYKVGAIEGTLNVTGTTGTFLTPLGTWASDGKVGIGTTQPGARLTVTNSAADTVGLAVTQTGNYFGGAINVSGSTTGAGLSITGNAAGSDQRLFTVSNDGTSNGNVLKVQSNGLVGIGNIAPSNKLHVTGNIGATGWIGAGCEVGCETSNGYVLMYADGSIVNTSTITSAGIVNANGGLSQDGFNIINGGDTWLRTSGATGWYNASYSVGVYATQAGTVSLYNGASLYVPGGITSVGTVTAPTFSTSGNGAGITSSDATWLRINPASAYFKAQYIYQDGPVGYVASINSTLVANYVPKADGSYRLTDSQIIDNGTNVGIGISPTYKLEVGGHTVVRGDIYCESCGNWLSAYVNQGVKTSSSPTFYTLTLNSALSSSFSMIRGGYTGVLNNAGNGYFALGIGSGYMQAYTGGAVGGSAAWSNWSDIRLKKNIDTISDPLSIITQLRGVSFNWKDPKRDQKTEYGFIAQEVEQVLPSLITEMSNGNDTNDKTKYKAITPSEITPFLVEGMKEQQTQIEDLKSQLSDQQKQIDELRDLIRSQ